MARSLSQPGLNELPGRGQLRHRNITGCIPAMIASAR